MARCMNVGHPGRSAGGTGIGTRAEHGRLSPPAPAQKPQRRVPPNHQLKEARAARQRWWGRNPPPLVARSQPTMGVVGALSGDRTSVPEMAAGNQTRRRRRAPSATAHFIAKPPLWGGGWQASGRGLGLKPVTLGGGDIKSQQVKTGQQSQVTHPKSWHAPNLSYANPQAINNSSIQWIDKKNAKKKTRKM